MHGRTCSFDTELRRLKEGAPALPVGPIWLHPTRTSGWPDYPTEERSRYELWWLFGWPYDTAVCMARLVFSGILERHPDLKLIAHHGGSMVPYFAGRVGPGMDQLGARTPDGEKELLADASALPRRPIDYFRRFYVDTALFGASDALACSLAFFGEDQMLFASDSPFDPERGPGYIRATIDNVDQLQITAQAREKIYEDNARRLLTRLPAPGSATVAHTSTGVSAPSTLGGRD
jgi:aminocarboxymuconate-semialdehyde decarboxylase